MDANKLPQFGCNENCDVVINFRESISKISIGKFLSRPNVNLQIKLHHLLFANIRPCLCLMPWSKMNVNVLGAFKKMACKESSLEFLENLLD